MAEFYITDQIFNKIIYWFCFLLMFLGLFLTLISNNLVKKLIGLSIFQTSVLLIFIALSYVSNSFAPILRENADLIYSNPLPHVLMLTAIVVGVAIISVGLSLVIKIKKQFGTVEEDEIMDEYIKSINQKKTTISNNNND